ncbi:uncharacterized protein EV422DRAFT_4222 [Fimicolochytrium jonesii]|uniref:uncharacterized protein n=1 Tax=Fimicolochytrium jonesii TaxID=1396493 RepID=UPI0022FE3859|nr:uncharacterized protein EV422DRAFT_4222 [Fimicolochytrium jonesii]KAI8826617.1 hypothetical protein EV422DRAFT_4222 [Fimicolochytrium jonesii]
MEVVADDGFGGSPFPAITDEPLQKASAIEVVAKLPIPPNAIAITGDGDLYVSFHSRHDRGNLKLAKWDPKTQNLTAWPTEKRQLSYWQITSLKLHGNSLYALDDGINGLTNKPKVVAFDLQKGDERLRYRTGTGRGSLVADLAVHPDGKSLYIADASMIRGLPKIFAIDVETGGRSVVLKGHHSLKANRSASILDATGTHTLRWAYFGAFPYRPAVSALAIDAKNDAMYFAAPSSREAFKVPLSQLDYARDTNSHKSARPYVSKFLDHKPVSGGMVVATNGDLYIADPQTSAIRVYSTRSGQPVLKTLVRDPEVLRWPGQLAIRDGYLYVACSALDTAFTGRKVEGGGLVVRVPLLV